MEIRESEFDETVLKSDRPVLVDFWASWCPPCKMMQPVVDKLSNKVVDWADVYSINIDRSPALAATYLASGVPTFISFANGNVVDRKTGALTEGQLTGLLTKASDAMRVNGAGTGALGADGSAKALQATEASSVGDKFTQATEASSVGDEFTQAIAGSSAEARPFITIVSGLPRSGTSLMMRMLNAGGIPALCDELRTPDADNPNGYYEFEDVKCIEQYSTWLERAPGHAVKMVYSLLKHLPVDREYRVVFMRRHVDEVLQSQKKMLERNGIATDIPDAQLKALFERELRQFYAWLPSQRHLKLVNISYNELLSRPDSTVAQINRHFDYALNTEPMVRMIDPSLHRNRAA
jgi:thioredoxin